MSLLKAKRKGKRKKKIIMLIYVQAKKKERNLYDPQALNMLIFLCL